MIDAWIAGAGLWTPGFADLAAWASGVRDSAALEPAATLLPSRLARRASLLTRMSVEALEQAAAGAALDQVATVFVTAYGESQTLGALLDQLYAEGVLSPARFSSSVHSAAAGIFGIAAKNKAFSTTVAAGFEGVAMGLLESVALLEQRGGEVVAVFADEEPLAPFARAGLSPLATALRLVADRPAAPLGRLCRLRPGHGLRRPALPATFSTNPAALSLPLLEAVHQRRPGTVALSSGWQVDLEATP